MTNKLLRAAEIAPPELVRKVNAIIVGDDQGLVGKNGGSSLSTKVVHDGVKRRPPAAGKGRPKGATNKVTRELKDMILGALDAAGGVEYLQERAQDPRTASAFLSLVGKTLPLTVKGTGANGEHVFQKIIVEVVKAQ